MGFNFKSIMKGKNNANPGDVTQVKKNTQTTDNIISQAVTNAGNISSMTMSKEEHDRLISARHKMPVHIVLLKYFSLILMAAAIIVGLLLKADLSPDNSYLSFLGMNENTASSHIKQSREKNALTDMNKVLSDDVESVKERRAEFDQSTEAAKVALLVPEIIEIEEQQKRWFNEIVEEEDDKGKLKEVQKYGLIDSFNDMIDYFESKDYQPRFFNQKNRDISLTESEPAVCKRPNNKLSAADLAEKRRLEADGRCLTNSTLIMANTVEIRGLNINASGASVSVSASDLLSRVFTLSSEFVVMMNSFDFYKGATLNNFSRRELDEGGDNTEIALRLEFQDPEDEDPNDQYIKDFVDWKENQN